MYPHFCMQDCRRGLLVCHAQLDERPVNPSVQSRLVGRGYIEEVRSFPSTDVLSSTRGGTIAGMSILSRSIGPVQRIFYRTPVTSSVLAGSHMLWTLKQSRPLAANPSGLLWRTRVPTRSRSPTNRKDKEVSTIAFVDLRM
jgi:hypothetical protein